MTEITTSHIGHGIRENDFVFITNEAAQESPDLRQTMWQGGTVKSVRNGVAEIRVTTIVRLPVSKLTTGDNAYDPIA